MAMDRDEVGIQMTVTERVIPAPPLVRWGEGTPPAGITPMPPQAGGTIEQSLGNPQIRRPGVAQWVSTYPEVIAALTTPTPTVAQIGQLPGAYRVPAPGIIRIAGALTASAPGAVPTWSVDGGDTWWELNAGASITPGAWWEQQVTVVPGLAVDFSTSTATTWAGWWALFVPSA